MGGTYQLMMVVFGEKFPGENENTNKHFAFKSQASAVSEAPSLAEDTNPRKNLGTTPRTKVSEQVRMSKIQKLAEVVRKALIRSSLLEGKYHYTNQANKAITAALC